MKAGTHKMKQKITYTILITAVIIAAVAVSVLNIVNSDEPARALCAVPNGQTSVTAFFDFIIDGDYQQAQKYLYNCTSLGFENEPDSEVGKKILSAVRESYDYSIAGDFSSDGQYATQKVRFTYFSVADAKDTISEYTQEFYKQKIESATVNSELYDENNNLREDVALDLFEMAADRVISEKDNYLRTIELDLELYYHDGEWKIVLSDDLASALMGDMY